MNLPCFVDVVFKRIPSILSVAVASCKCGVTITYEIHALCRVGEFDIQHFSCIRTVFASQEVMGRFCFYC
ncbi:hypothetical protein R1flu_003703 [Riccia fluitans]|uniref:Secreted protein n=1 Tax=Riccia fluitans TaxID=41844 RepID=A0ABD1Y9S4_9MARC